MDTSNLQAFVAVAEHGSFSKAGDSLFLTQPAISKRVALLEEQLDSKLFDRIGRTVSMTEAGNALLPRARKILLQLEDAKRAVTNLSTGDITGRLSLAASHHISQHRLPPYLRKFSQTYPKVALDLRFEESEVAYESVLKGDLELAIITLSPEPDPNIHSETIWTDTMVYVAANDHPLAQAEQLQLADLTGLNAILPGSNTFTRSLLEQLFLQRNLPLNVTMSTNYLDTIRMMISIGLGWGLLPEKMIQPGMTVLKVVDSAPVQRHLGIIFHRNRTLSNAATALVTMLKAEADTGVTTTQL